MKIRITVGEVAMDAQLDVGSRTAQAIYDVLPVDCSYSTWGDEIYFTLPAQASPENAREVVEAGDLGFWIPGSAMCIFYGLTPASQGDEIRPASAVNVFGHLLGDPTVFRNASAATISVERVEE